jgi:hypothetical protein
MEDYNKEQDFYDDGRGYRIEYRSKKDIYILWRPSISGWAFVEIHSKDDISEELLNKIAESYIEEHLYAIEEAYEAVIRLQTAIDLQKKLGYKITENDYCE